MSRKRVDRASTQSRIPGCHSLRAIRIASRRSRSLHGLPAPPPERCRVLELGCGNGGNLIPMAYVLLESTFLGLDSAGSAIARGREQICRPRPHERDARSRRPSGRVEPRLVRLRHRTRRLLVGAAAGSGAGARDRLRSARSERHRVRELQHASRMARPNRDAPDDAVAHARQRGSHRENRPGASPRPVPRRGRAAAPALFRDPEGNARASEGRAGRRSCSTTISPSSTSPCCSRTSSNARDGTGSSSSRKPTTATWPRGTPTARAADSS